MWWMSLAFGQAYEAQPCEAEPALKDALAKGELEGITPHGPTYAAGAASSLLKPSPKKEPAKPKTDDSDALIAWQEQHDDWTCTYGAPKVVDGDITTAWSEGARGLGVGEVLVVELPDGDGPLEMRAGYAKSDERWAQNARPKEVEVVLLGPGWEPPVQGTMYMQLPVLGRHTVELKDVNAWQPLPLPDWKTPEDYAPDAPRGWKLDAQEPRFLAIRIVSATKGSKWEDTLISEIRRKP